LYVCRSEVLQESDKKRRNEQRTFFDNASNLLTNLLNAGGLSNMPVAEGAVSDLFGRPLFFALYDWFLEVITYHLIPYLFGPFYITFFYFELKFMFPAWPCL
jgi:hypothetical protein